MTAPREIVMEKADGRKMKKNSRGSTGGPYVKLWCLRQTDGIFTVRDGRGPVGRRSTGVVDTEVLLGSPPTSTRPREIGPRV